MLNFKIFLMQHVYVYIYIYIYQQKSIYTKHQLIRSNSFGAALKRPRALLTKFLTAGLAREFCNPIDDWLD